eukprot:885392-Prorocentrum_minimum.AAC.1
MDLGMEGGHRGSYTEEEFEELGGVALGEEDLMQLSAAFQTVRGSRGGPQGVHKECAARCRNLFQTVRGSARGSTGGPQEVCSEMSKSLPDGEGVHTGGPQGGPQGVPQLDCSPPPRE